MHLAVAAEPSNVLVMYARIQKLGGRSNPPLPPTSFAILNKFQAHRGDTRGTVATCTPAARVPRGKAMGAAWPPGLAALRARGAELRRSYFLALLAEAYGQAGQANRGLGALAEALDVVEKRGERRWEPELYQLKGDLLLKKGALGGGGQATLEGGKGKSNHRLATGGELLGPVHLLPDVVGHLPIQEGFSIAQAEVDAVGPARGRPDFRAGEG